MVRAVWLALFGGFRASFAPGAVPLGAVALGPVAVAVATVPPPTVPIAPLVVPFAAPL